MFLSNISPVVKKKKKKIRFCQKTSLEKLQADGEEAIYMMRTCYVTHSSAALCVCVCLSVHAANTDFLYLGDFIRQHLQALLVFLLLLFSRLQINLEEQTCTTKI